MGIQQLEVAVEKLPNEEFQQFMKWLVEFVPTKEGASEWLFDIFHAMWDKQIENDIDSGKFDALFEELREEYRQGLSKPL